MTFDSNAREQLQQISTGTITTILFKHGLRNVWTRGPRHQFGKAPRVAGPAFTMRFIAYREDLCTPSAWSSPKSTRACVEAMPDGSIAVVEAGGRLDAGAAGDILCARMQARGVQALLTDGAVRDAVGIRSLDFDVWAAGIAAPPAVSFMHFVGWQEPVTCGGVAVLPDDIIVADDDGAVVIPAALVDEVVRVGVEQERQEAWILGEVQKGGALAGLYPMSEETRRRYETGNP
ncbi:regulator of RNase E activity RraA [Paraburkholderia sp. GAS206C]|jgi:regulator of RNase E activity RraA|uniref:ribonuclease activity regulator RraA n=1 Tax=unclassified Paraburkholderia TaxID=2615204 RepID=UPI003D1A63A9